MRGASFGLDANLRPMGYEQITDLTTVKPLTVPTANSNGHRPVYAMLQTEGGDVRFRDDGSNPTVSVGMVLTDTPWFYTGDIRAIRFIAPAGVKLNVSYYR